ncbi:hypothetical protein DL767_011448 [Monosporascus sp. MG133]|nr:hypothetical protein DL767_011448 [Monosporascus sp. MG133]
MADDVPGSIIRVRDIRVRDPMSEDMQWRRRTILGMIGSVLDKSPDELDYLVDWARGQAILFLFDNKVEPCISIDFFQWRVELVMWRCAKDIWLFPFRDQQPVAYAEPFSLEYKDAYENFYWQYERAVFGVGNPVAETMGRLALQASKEPEETAAPLPALPELSRLSLGVPNKVPATTQAVLASPSSSAARTSAPSGSTTKPVGQATGKKPASSAKPGAASGSQLPRGPEESKNALFYMWSEKEAQTVWDDLYPTRENFNVCVVSNINRTNELLDNRFVHLVWRRSNVARANGYCWMLALSAVSKDVDISDAPFQNSLAIAWDGLSEWLEAIQASNFDINLAEHLEQQVCFGLHHYNNPDRIAKNNKSTAKVDNFITFQVNIVAAQRRAFKAEMANLTSEAEKHILDLLLSKSRFEEREAVAKD